MSIIDWMANQGVDELAKAAAATDRVPAKIMKQCQKSQLNHTYRERPTHRPAFATKLRPTRCLLIFRHCRRRRNGMRHAPVGASAEVSRSVQPLRQYHDAGRQRAGAAKERAVVSSAAEEVELEWQLHVCTANDRCGTVPPVAS